MSESAQESVEQDSDSGFWPDSQADGLSVIVVLVALVALALHFVAGDLVIEGLLWVASLFG